MSLYAIADLHLSRASNKLMNIFKGWDNHTERLLENWNNKISQDDTVVIAGDISWGNNVKEALPDLEFINNQLKGRKIILKGNHDFWWNTLNKNIELCERHGFSQLSFLHNNAFLTGDVAVCGTRGWVNESNTKQDEKLQKREALRLKASILAAKGLGASEIYAFLHYPPIYGDYQNYEILDVIQRYQIKHCFYGHLHGASHKNAVSGKHYGIEFTLISADFVGFTPIKVKNY